MLSGKLVHLIEAHWDRITSRVLDQIHREPEMSHTRALVESELRDRAEILLHNLGHWLSAGEEKSLATAYEQLGELHYEEGVPLYEAVHALCILREQMVDFVEEHIDSKTSLELYAEEELDRRLGRFFDLLVIHMVKGYERALRHEAVDGRLVTAR
jgi:hypothetical protein